MRAAAALGVVLLLVSFALFPLSLKPRFQSDPSIQLISKTLATFHKGLAAWGFYTNTNQQALVAAYVFDPVSENFLKLQDTKPLVASETFLFRAQTAARFEAITSAIIRRSPANASWLCENVMLPKKRRIYYAMSPLGGKAPETFLVPLAESETRIDHQILQDEKKKAFLLSFVCRGAG